MFRRGYSALYKAIVQFFPPSASPSAIEEKKLFQQSLLQALAPLIPAPTVRKFHLFGLDATPMPRPFAKTLEDRTYIHQPNTIKGNKPINIGHLYSLLSFLPEPTQNYHIPWSIPLSGQRVTADSNPIAVGLEQIETVLSDCPIFHHNQLSVLAADSYYSQRQFLDAIFGKPNAVVVTRARSNRVFYRQPEVVEAVTHRGHRRWYGERFDLKDEATRHFPDEIVETSFTTRRGRSLDLTITCWYEMLMRGTKEYPMHQHPFTLLRVQVTDQMTGKLLWRPMWLIVMGQRRYELTPLELSNAYRQRFDMEHMLRFGKQRLLMGSFQTPDVNHEENWVQLTLLCGSTTVGSAGIS